MKLIKLLYLSSVVLGTYLLMSNEASAREYAAICDGCSEYAMKLKAKSTVRKVQGTHDIYVMNFTKRKLHKYTATVSYFSFDDVYHTTIYEVGVTDTTLIIYQELADNINRLNGQKVDIPDDVANSVYDIIHSRQAQSTVGYYVYRNDFTTRAAGYTLLGPAIIGKLADVNFYINLQFSDGTSARFKLNGLMEDGSLELTYMPGSANDSNGSYIPESAQDVIDQGGIINQFNDYNAYNDMVNYLTEWNIMNGNRTDCYTSTEDGGYKIICKAL